MKRYKRCVVEDFHRGLIDLTNQNYCKKNRFYYNPYLSFSGEKISYGGIRGKFSMMISLLDGAISPKTFAVVNLSLFLSLLSYIWKYHFIFSLF